MKEGLVQSKFAAFIPQKFRGAIKEGVRAENVKGIRGLDQPRALPQGIRGSSTTRFWLALSAHSSVALHLVTCELTLIHANFGPARNPCLPPPGRFHRATLEKRFSTSSGAGTVTGPNTPSPGNGHLSTPRSSVCSTSPGAASTCASTILPPGINTTLAMTGESTLTTRSRSGSGGAVGFPVGNGGGGDGSNDTGGGTASAVGATGARKSFPSCSSYSPGARGARSRPAGGVGKMTVSHSSGSLPSAAAAAAAAVSGVYASVPAGNGT